MKGIILAGGHGTRLHPITRGSSKQLLPLYDKPMVYYPLSMLMFAGIRDILIISTPDQLPAFRRLLSTGSQWGLNFQYAEQAQPRGLADAFLVGRAFIGGQPSCLILGDNVFFGHGLPETLQRVAKRTEGATVFAYPVRDPGRYGVVELDDDEHVIGIEEKPEKPRSHLAIPGMYFFDHRAVEFAGSLTPSARGEVEITDLLRIYMEHDELAVEVLGRGVAWLDAGTHDALIQASNFVQAVQQRQGLMISCPEEIAYRLGYIDVDSLRSLAEMMGNNEYRDYLFQLLDPSLVRREHRMQE